MNQLEVSWRTCREFHSAEWPDGAVVYDQGSGDTHHFTLATFAILKLIHASPNTLKALASHVLSSDSVAQENALSAVEEIVAELHELGFIEPVSH